LGKTQHKDFLKEDNNIREQAGSAVLKYPFLRPKGWIMLEKHLVNYT
jgi:hypothetical protein